MLSLLDRVPFPLTDERTFFARNDPQGYLDRQETGTADIEGVTGGMTVAVDDDANDGGARVGYVEDPNYDVGTWLVQGGESYQGSTEDHGAKYLPPGWSYQFRAPEYRPEGY